MAPDFLDHLTQAKHNQDCANRFLMISTDRDWAITAAFYAALHFTLAGLICKKIYSIPIGDERSLHAAQSKKIKEIFGSICYKDYQKLFFASDKVRYIRDYSGISSNQIPSLNYFSQSDVNTFVKCSLPNIKQEIEKVTNANFT